MLRDPNCGGCCLVRGANRAGARRSNRNFETNSNSSDTTTPTHEVQTTARMRGHGRTEEGALPTYPSSKALKSSAQALSIESEKDDEANFLSPLPQMFFGQSSSMEWKSSFHRSPPAMFGKPLF